MTDGPDATTRTWRDFPRPSDNSYYEERFPFLSQGDIFDLLPLLLVPPELSFLETEHALPVAAIPVLETRGIIVTPTCDFRRRGADDLAAHPDVDPYTLRQQLVVARVLSFDEWERATPAAGRADRVAQLRSYDNQRQYMYLPHLEGAYGESMVDFGSMWTLPLELLRRSTRLTQLAEAGAVQLQYKLTMYGTALIVERDRLRPPMD